MLNTKNLQPVQNDYFVKKNKVEFLRRQSLLRMNNLKGINIS